MPVSFQAGEQLIFLLRTSHPHPRHGRVCVCLEEAKVLAAAVELHPARDGLLRLRIRRRRWRLLLLAVGGGCGGEGGRRRSCRSTGSAGGEETVTAAVTSRNEPCLDQGF